MGKSVVGVAALAWLFVVGCADVPRDNKYDANAPLGEQAPGLVDVSVETPAANPNDPNTPIASATVKLTGPDTDSGTTDTTGNTIINALTPGAYSVLVSATGYYDNVGTVNVLPGQESSVVVTLHAAPDNGNLAATGSIVGVVAKSDQLGLSDADNSGITASTMDPGQPSVSTTTAVTGEFTLNVIPGPHTVVFSAPGYASVTFTNVFVSAGNTTAPCSGDVILQQQN